jgi:hypothetical protein
VKSKRGKVSREDAKARREKKQMAIKKIARTTGGGSFPPGVTKKSENFTLHTSGYASALKSPQPPLGKGGASRFACRDEKTFRLNASGHRQAKESVENRFFRLKAVRGMTRLYLIFELETDSISSVFPQGHSMYLTRDLRDQIQAR